MSPLARQVPAGQGAPVAVALARFLAHIRGCGGRRCPPPELERGDDASVALNRRTFLMLTSALGVGATLRPWRRPGQDQSVLRIRSYSDLQVLDPLNRLAQPEGDIMDAIFSNLVKAKPGETWDWQLDAAEAIEQVDERHIDFTLRKGIQFTGGFGELTADDVKYSFERIADPKNESPYKDDWAVLDRVEVKDPYIGTIVLKEPFAPLVDDQPGAGLGRDHVEKAIEQVGGKFTTEPPAMSGPYVLKEWQPKQTDDPRAQPRLLRAGARFRRGARLPDRGREDRRDRVRGGRAGLHGRSACPRCRS